jgi:hypothetical protein
LLENRLRRQWAALFAPGASRGTELRQNRAAAVVLGTRSCRTLFAHAGSAPHTRLGRVWPVHVVLNNSPRLT